MQIEKAPANQENVFISLTADAANAHNTNKHTANAHNILFEVRFFCWLWHLQCACCQIDKSCFLNLLAFFFYLQRVELSRRKIHNTRFVLDFLWPNL